MKHYTVFHALALSFFSKPFYRFVGKTWKGLGFAYLLLLLAVVWVPVMIATQARINAIIDYGAPPFINQIPPITLKDGTVSVDAPMPYTIIDPGSGVQILAIDTTGTIHSLEQTQAVALLTKTALLVRGQEPFELTTLKPLNVMITSEGTSRLLQTVRNWFAVVAYPFAVAGSYCYRVVQALIYGLIGLLFANILKARREYAMLVQLSLVAVTPAIVLNGIRSVLGIFIPFWGLIMFLLSMGYLFFAVKATAEDQGTPAS